MRTIILAIIRCTLFILISLACSEPVSTNEEGSLNQGECRLTSECSSSQVCLNGQCVDESSLSPGAMMMTEGGQGLPNTCA